MPTFGDNPFDDGLDFVGCPPQPTKPKLPKFPEDFERECKLICWGRCKPIPDGERVMTVVIDDFEPDPRECGVYTGELRFKDVATGAEWYKGELKFYYTRNYIYTGESMYEEKRKSIAFRFVVKGDIERVSDDIPNINGLEWPGLILCTKKSDKVDSYDKIFVYGGLDILFDVESEKTNGFMLGLGHNDGWYTHHPKCSRRPIDWHSSEGDYLGHYCDRGWLFVSPGKSFVFEPGILPPTGKFSEEAFREIGRECYTEDSIKDGAFDLTHRQCINSYQKLYGTTECNTSFNSTEFCQGLVYSGEGVPWITFFSMGYWMDRYGKPEQILHLAEGNLKVDNEKYEEKYGKELYFYGFATQNHREELKLVDLASNKDIIGEPVDTNLLLYLYNAGALIRNPKLKRFIPVDLKLSAKLLRAEIEATKDKELCPFL